jgi:hypothetical protein
MDNDISLLERTDGSNSQKVRLAWSRADEKNMSIALDAAIFFHKRRLAIVDRQVNMTFHLIPKVSSLQHNEAVHTSVRI